MSKTLLLLSALAAGSICAVIPSTGRPEGVATVQLNLKTGPSQSLASGFINGIPQALGQIPLKFFQDIKFQTSRSSGTYIQPPGWLAGPSGYQARWDAAMTNYNVAKDVGARISIPIHGLWGAPAAVFPGDNGNWTEFDLFLETFIKDVKTNGLADPDTIVMTELWNEADQVRYWNRTRTQWLDLWGRAYHKMKQEIPNIEILGPTIADAPTVDNEWHTAWADFVVANGSIPDRYTYEAGEDVPDTEEFLKAASDMRKAHGLPDLPILFNEYGPALDRQNPSGDSFKIAQVERVNARGLRSNWYPKETAEIHDYMSGLVAKPNANTSQYDHNEGGYWPTAEFQVYKYYAQNMTGERVTTQPTKDYEFDVYATVDCGTLRILTGARNSTGNFEVHVSGLESEGWPSDGTVTLRTWEFWGSADHFARVDAPVDGGLSNLTFSNSLLKLSVNQSDRYSTKAYEIKLAK